MNMIPYQWSSISSAYISLVTQILPGPQSISYLIAFLLLPAALMIPPSTLSHRQLCSLFLPTIYACVLHAWLAIRGTDVISMGIILWSTFLLAFKDPRVDFRQVHRLLDPPGATSKPDASLVPGVEKHAEHQDFRRHDTAKGSPKQEQNPACGGTTALQSPVPSRPTQSHFSRGSATWEEPYPAALLPRLLWVITLLGSVRLHSWKINSPTHDATQSHLPPPPTRLQFTVQLVPDIISTLLLLSTTTHLAHHDPHLTITPFPHTTPPPLTALLLQHTVLRPLILGLYTLSLLRVQFLLSTPLLLLSNSLLSLPPTAWSPHTLPPFFGSFTSVLDHGLAGLWGKWWHQHVRIMDSAPGVALADALGLQRGAKPRYALLVCSTFFFSGITHMGLVPPAPLWSSTPPNRLRVQIAGFFWVQAVGVLGEAVVEEKVFGTRTARRTDRRGRAGMLWKILLARTVRLLWVVAWLALTLRLLVVPARELGLWYLWPPVPTLLPGFVKDTLGGSWLGGNYW